MSSDERLAKRAAGGDRRAFEAIYRRYSQDLYRFSLAMVGNPQDAQDTLQNAMVKVLRALPGETREIRLKPWLYRIVRNESVETLRRRREIAELEPDQATVSAASDTVEARERLRTLLADLEQLPERQRAALVMRELGGLEFAEIGAAFGSSAAVARQTLYEARLSLRQLSAGREMRCADVMRELSDGDGRVVRRREIRAHLRSCADCRAFREEISRRRGELAAISPLPAAVAAGLLKGALSSQAAAGGSAAGGGGLGGGGLAAAGTGKAAATSVLAKSAAAVAVATVVGVSVADRGGLVDLPLGGGERPAPVGQPATQAGSAAAGGKDQPTTEETVGQAAGQTRAEVPAQRRAVIAAAAKRHATGANRRDGAADETNGAGDAIGTTPGSRSQAGFAPPGGGHGRSASDRRGRPEQLPQAAEHGQQTAAANKDKHAPAAQHGSGGNAGHGVANAPKGEPKGAPAKDAAPETLPTPSPPAHSKKPPSIGPDGQGDDSSQATKQPVGTGPAEQEQEEAP